MRLFALLLPVLLQAAPLTVAVRLTDGTVVEGTTATKSLGSIRLEQVLSIHNGASASEAEARAIAAGISAIQEDKDRAARDRAVEELTAIGLPVVTPLLKAYKDTDQHEPRPLYRLFERVMPSSADQFDRTLSLVRLKGSAAQRLQLPEATLQLQTSGGEKKQIPLSQIRTLAVRQKLVSKSAQVHTLRHCNQIEYLDSGIQLSADSRLTSTATGFGRLSWSEDGWASDPNGLTKPGGPAYKTNLVNGHPFGALLGRSSAKGEVFFLGKQATKSGLPAGRLQLAVNDNRHWQNNLGTYSVTLQATDAYDLGEPQ